jgi:hypothetical protein
MAVATGSRLSGGEGEHHRSTEAGVDSQLGLLLTEEQSLILEAIGSPCQPVVVDRQLGRVGQHHMGMPLPLKGPIEA